MEDLILISNLNDFIFCPVSIYFHKLYGKLDKKLYQSEYQINGTNAHKAIDNKKYSSRKNILQGIDIYSSKYGIEGKIDIFDIAKKELVSQNEMDSKYHLYPYEPQTHSYNALSLY